MEMKSEEEDVGIVRRGRRAARESPLKQEDQKMSQPVHVKKSKDVQISGKKRTFKEMSKKKPKKSKAPKGGKGKG